MNDIRKTDMDYTEFLERKTQLGGMHGFEPLWMPSWLFPFQQALTDWSTRKGRGAKLADCGLGKGPMGLVWAENVIRKTNGKILFITPIAVGAQIVREGEKFGIEVERSTDGKPKKNITVTNYQRLHQFDPNDYVGIVADESSCVKNAESQTQAIVNQFTRLHKYKLLLTATAAPNDFIELLTSAEILGEVGRQDALGMFFKNDENSLHPIWWGARWRFKPHAEERFWQWVCSWARAVRKPSDLGFDDGDFVLPPLHMNETIVHSAYRREGELFQMPAITLAEQRDERKNTITERCEEVARRVEGKDFSIQWCHLDKEGDLLEKLIPGAVQVSGKDSDDEKEEKLTAFALQQIKRLVIKPVIGAWGLNLQHCAHMTTFPSHSFEQSYQSIRRCWRFGQKRPVYVDIITTEGELGVLKNLRRKSEAADRLFDMLTSNMNNAMKISTVHKRNNQIQLPTW